MKESLENKLPVAQRKILRLVPLAHEFIRSIIEERPASSLSEYWK